MSGSNPDQLWNLVPRGPVPLTGLEQFLATTTASPTAPLGLYSVGDIITAFDARSVIAAGSTTARKLTDRFADRYSALDWLTAGQPDGTTDNSVELQAAIDAAAGVVAGSRWSAPGRAQLLIPAAANPYIIGTTLYVPSNAHIIIERGATLKLGPAANASMVLLCNFATNILIEVYGTLDGNSSQQSFMPNSNFSATSPFPTTISVGIGSDRINGGSTRNPAVQGGFCSHVRIIGNRSGLITNFQNDPISLVGATDCEVSGLSMTNSAFHGGSVQVVGWRNFPYNQSTGIPLTFTGTYTASTGIVTLTTSVPHNMVPGEELITEFVTGSSGSFNAATGQLFTTLPGTGGTTVVYNGTGGGSNAVITGGRITNWFYQQATIASGTYVPATGIITVTTTTPHQLTYGQTISSNVTSGSAATIATGVFQLLDVTNGQGEPAIVGAKNVTLRYRTTRSGTMENITSGSYNTSTGIVTLTTDASHGLSPGDVVTVGLTGSGFLSGISSEQVCSTGTTGTTVTYVGPSGLSGIVIGGGTVYGGPTGAISGGTIGVSTKAWNSGFDNCFIDQIRDIGPCIYGGGVACYIRNSEVTRNLGTGPYLFSDANSGRCVDCEISGNYIHDNLGAGVGTANFGPGSIPHTGTRIFNNYITGNRGGAGFSSCDGLECANNYFYKNRAAGLNTYGSIGEIIVAPDAVRVSLAGNTIRDPCLISTIMAGTTLTQVVSGTYNSATGAVSLTTAIPHNLYTNAYFAFSGATGTGAFASINGRYVAEASTSKTVLNFHAAAGLGAATITGGQLVPNGFGIVIHDSPDLYIADNFIGDYQSPPTMLAAIGGSWGVRGVCTGNFYGPRINAAGNFPADMSTGAVQGENLDAVTKFTNGTTLRQPFTNDSAETYAATGIQVGYNRSGGRGESDIYVGAGNAVPGGFDFIKIIGIAVSSGSYTSSAAAVAASGNTYDTDSGVVVLTTSTPHGISAGVTFGLSAVSGTNDIGQVTDLNGLWITTAVTTSTLTFTGPPGLGAITITGGNVGIANVSITTRSAHGLTVGSRFNLSLVIGTDSIGPTDGRDISKLNGNWIAVGGTSGTTINFALTVFVAGVPVPETGLDILSITAGAINSSSLSGGVIDTTVGLPVGVSTGGTLGLTAGGSLLANDGIGNLRLSGALVHGATQVSALANAGTVTIAPDNSMVLIRNSASIATGTIVLPIPTFESWQDASGFNELEINFQNAIGTLTVTAGGSLSVTGAPSSIAAAGNSINFIQNGDVWLRRIMV